MTSRRRIFVGPLAAIGLLLAAPPASANEIEDFYRGRQIQFVVGFEVGGGYDVYGRLLSRHLPRHIPGRPTAIVQNMTGAGGRVAANWLYNVAAKDGAVLGVTSQSVPVDQALQQTGIRYDATRFNWIGNPSVDNQVTIAFADSGIATMDDLKKKDTVVCGGTGATTNPVIFPKIINQLIGSRIRVVTGYQGAAPIILAMERREVDCMGSHSWAAGKVTLAQLFRNQKINILVQWGTAKDSEISAVARREVPIILDYARNDEDREVLTLFNLSITIGRPLLAPPDIPRARLYALRRAFDDTMRDPDFLAEARRMNLDIKPLAGLELQELVASITHTSPLVIERAAALLK